jgi:hypothetical protein
MITRRHRRWGDRGSVFRAVLACLVAGALVVSSAFSFSAHAFHPDRVALQASPDIGSGSPEQPCDGALDGGCHCACQHFGGIVAPVAMVEPSPVPALRVAAILPANRANPPAAPHRPPIA